jgi:hypothetical protein
MSPARLTRWALAAILAFALCAKAQDLSGIPAAYVDIGMGVRPLAMGGAFTGLAENENAARWNPAALAVQKRFSAGFTYANQLNLIPYNYLAGTLPMRRAGVGWYIESSGDDVLRENTIALAYGLTADRISFMPTAYNLAFGMTGKVRWATFGENEDGGEGQVRGDAFGYGFDIGVYIRLPWSPSLTAGVVLHDAVNTITWNTSTSGAYEEGVPRVLTAGLAYRLRERTIFTADIKPALYDDVNHRFALGGEYLLMRVIALRAGVTQDIGSTRANRDVTVGIGLRLKLLSTAHLQGGVSYLFNDLANTPRAGVSFSW